jgi:hypothetical protein
MKRRKLRMRAAFDRAFWRHAREGMKWSGFAEHLPPGPSARERDVFQFVEAPWPDR